MSITGCEFFAGCIGGASGVLVGHPLDTIKTWQQATNASIGRAMYKIVTRNSGLNGFYRGMMFPLWTNGAINSLMFGVYGQQLRMLQSRYESPKEKERLLMQHIFLAGTVAGFLQSFLACPFELIKIKLQTHKYYRPAEAQTIRSYVKYLIQRHGFRFMFRGLPLTIGRDVVPYGIYMFTYAHLMHAMKQYVDLGDLKMDPQQKVHHHRVDVGEEDNLVLTVLAGSVAGVLSWVVVIPFDVVKTKMQADDTYRSSWHCIVDCYQRNGWKSWFRGGYMVLVRAIPFNAATFVGYEWAIEQCVQVISDKRWKDW